DVLQYPEDLGAGKVRVERQTNLRLESLDTAIRGQAVHDRLRSGVLPHDRVVHRFTSVLVPDDRGLALIRDTDGSNVVAGDVRLAQRFADHLTGVGPDLLRVVLDPPGAR